MMKILNEKGIIYFARSGSPVDKKGVLHIKGELNKVFKKRWFVLKGNLLFYYNKKGERDPLGLIILEGYTIEAAEDMDNFIFMINFAGLNLKTYSFAAHSQQAMESWMKSLSCASFDYLRVKVLELQSKLDEISMTGTNLVQAATKDGHVLAQVYAPMIHAAASSSHTDLPGLASALSISELQDKRVSCSSSIIFEREVDRTDVKTVTWSKLGIHSFAEMHEFVKQQIDQFQSDIREETELRL